jgi:hypothetical protein
MADRLEPMDEERISSIVDHQITRAQRFAENELEPVRDKALEYLRGEVDIVAEKGKSSVTSNDLTDHLNWLMPGVVRVFLATDEVVTFEPTKQQMEVNEETGQQEDVSEERAKQAKDYINYEFLQRLNGYNVVRSCIHDGLVLGNGILKHYWDPTPEYKVEGFYGLDELQLMQLLTHPEVEEVLEYAARSDVAIPENFAPQRQAPIGQHQPPMGAGAVEPAPGPAPPPQGGPGSAVLPEGPGGLPPSGQMAGMAGVPEPAAQQPLAQPVPALSSGQIYDVKVRRKLSNGRLCIEVVPPEEFLISPQARCLDEDIDFCGHYYQRTRSDLVEEGYDLEFIDDKPAGSSRQVESNTRQARNGTSDPGYDDAADRSTELIDVYECYIKLDTDGDGVAERRRVVMVGGLGRLHLVENSAWDEDLPFSDIVPDPVPHRWRGNSLYERLRDVVRNKTVLLRQTLDNLYAVNNPMQEVVQDNILNLRALINRTLGANIFVKQQGSVTPIAVPFTAKESCGMLEYWDQIAEKRTGVGRHSMGLDPDALQNQTAEAVRDSRAAQSTKSEDYARNIEVGLRRAFKCILRLVHRHQDKPTTIRIRGKWTRVDPTAWDPDMDVIINTGLGSGSRDRDLMMIQGILAKQELILQTLGPSNPIVSLKEYRDTLAIGAEVSGIRNPERHFKEIDANDPALQPPPPQEDPKVVEAKAKMQLEQEKAAASLQLEQQKAQADLQLRQQMGQLEMQTQRDKIAADNVAAREKAQLDMQTFRDKTAAEIETTRQKHALELELMERKAVREMELKARELDLEAELRREEMKVQKAAQPNIEEAQT